MAVFLLSPLPAMAARTLSLSESIELALTHDPDTKNAQRSVEIGKLKHSKAVQNFLPKLETGFTYSPQTDYFGRPITTQYTYYSFAGLEQPLYTGGVLKNSLRLADSETRRQESDYQVKRLAVAAESIKAYYQALTTQTTIRQYESLCQKGEEDLRDAQARLEVGKGTRVEVLELSTKLLEAQQKLSKSRADQQTAISALKTLVGIEDTTSIKLAAEFPLQDIRGDLHTLLEEGQSKRPDLAYSQEDVTYNQLRADIERGKQLPQVSLIARQEWQSPNLMAGKKDWLVMLKATISMGNSTLSYNEQKNEIYPNLWAYPSLAPPRTYAFGVRTLKYSIFDRSSNKVELEQARSDRELASDRNQRTQRQIYYDIKNAYAQKEDSVARALTAQKQIAMAEELLNITQTKYTVGMGTLADVFKARSSLAEAQVNLITAQNDRAVALGQLYKALGRNLHVRESKL